MYLDWVRTIVAILIIVFLLYTIQSLVQPNPEGFVVVQTPQQQYNIPQLKAVTGRYIRIRPSLDSQADGFLTISQIQVFDVNNINVAYKKGVTATATSVGGSDVDKEYGRLILDGYVYILGRGESDTPDCVIDGITFPRNGLTEVFETSVQNYGPEDSQGDNQYLEIDLGYNTLISSVIYTGRNDAETREIKTIDGWIDRLTQEARNKGIRLEIFTDARVRTYKGIFPCTDPTIDKVQTIYMTESLYGVNLKSTDGVFGVKQTIDIPNLESFRAFTKPFLEYKVQPTREEDMYTSPIVLAHKPMITNIKTIYSNATIDISNNIFLPVLADSPVTFYYDLYAQAGCAPLKTQNEDGTWKYTVPNPPAYGYCRPNSVQPPPIIETIPVTIFGTASPTALQEMKDSLTYCKLLYLGSPPAIENFVRIHFSSNPTDPMAMKPFLRKLRSDLQGGFEQPERYCVPDVIQTFRSGRFVTSLSVQNQGWNETHCTREITCDVLGLIPFASRNFLVSWVANRVVRYRRFVNSLASNLADARAELTTANAGVAAAEAAYNEAIKPANYSPAESALMTTAIMLGGAALLSANVALGVVSAAVIAGIPSVRAAIEQSKVDKTKKARDMIQAMYNDVVNSGANVGNQTLMEEVATPQQIPIYVDVSSKTALNSFAQQLYEFLGGQFNITYIYDVLPLGSTMLDIRFDLVIHDDISETHGPINDLKAQYKRIQTATTVSKDILDQAAADYQIELSKLEERAIKSVSNPFKGAVARIFYTGGVKPTSNTCAKGVLSTNITITGLIFDDKAVTSFIPELNGGIPVALGTDPGNTNFQPTIKYTKNTTEPLDCRNSDTLRRIMDDYLNLVRSASSKYPLLTATPPLDVKKGELYINSVIGASQVSSTSCNITWTEMLYDYNTNLPMNPLGGSRGSSAPITRSARFSYSVDNTSWYNTELTLTIGGLKLLSPSEVTAANIAPLTPTLTFTKPLPVRVNLDNLSNVCPNASCEDTDVLFSLIDQYNSDPTQPGTIMTVTHAFTPNANQCDVKVSINYDAKIEDIIATEVRDPVTGITKKSYKEIKKGAITYSSVRGKLVGSSKAMPYSGVKDITLALYTAPDPTTCVYNLAGAGPENSGTSIQSNTPALFTPMIYTKELIRRNETQLGSSINKIQTDFSQTIGSTKDTLKAYRVDTYKAHGDIYSTNGLGGICAAKCSDTTIQDLMKDYYNKEIVQGVRIEAFLNIAQTQPNVCEAMFTTNSSDTLFSYKFFFDTAGTTSGSNPTCKVTNATQLYITSPTDDQILDIKKEMNAVIAEGFTSTTPPFPVSVVESEALSARGFGKDMMRNFTAGIKETQFELPLKQQEPERTTRHRPPSYKFLRFTPTAIRGGSTVNVGKFTFFYEDRPLLLKGSVTNPMGTWEGPMADVTGPGRRPGWSDAHKKSLVFAFRDPIAVDAYSFTTALPEAGIEGDPVAWKLEGSQNGTFWTLLDTQNFPTPLQRFIDLDTFYLNRR